MDQAILLTADTAEKKAVIDAELAVDGGTVSAQAQSDYDAAIVAEALVHDLLDEHVMAEMYFK